jgi:hypothetical protein
LVEEAKKKVVEAKDPTMDAGCGCEPNFVQNANTTSSPMLKAKDNASKSFKRVKTEMLGKAGTSE